MEILKQAIYDNYALWIGDNINKNLNILNKSELASKIYEILSDDLKSKVGANTSLASISQLFLDSATGNMTNLMNLLESDLKYEGNGHPYVHLSKIDVIDTIITHDHSNILETLWEKGEIHSIFESKTISNSNVNLFKILGDYTHPEKIVLTSQNMRKVKKLKLYDTFWNNLNSELSNKNLILLGVNLDIDTKEILEFAFSKLKSLTESRYFVTSNPLSLEDEEWLISKGFEFIYEEDESFISELYLYLNGREIEKLQEEKVNIVETIEEEPIKKIETIEKVEKKEENLVEKQIFEEDVIKAAETIENDNYTVKNLEIPVFLEGNILKGQIIETETRNRNMRLVEFRDKRYPSYKIDDFSEITHYKALDIKVPLENSPLPPVKIDRKIFSGKTNIECNGQIIYNVTIKSNMAGKYEVIDFKNHDFQLTLLLNEDKVINYFYKISENTINIKGKNIYIFFKNLFSGLELHFKNKKISGHFKITPNDDIDKFDLIIDNIDKFLTIKKAFKIRDINLKELLKNTRSLEVLYSYYTNTPKIIKGNITIRTNFSGELDLLDKLILSYPIGINFLGVEKSFIESTEIDLDNSNITYMDNKLEVQVFDTIQYITYEEIKSN